MGIEESFNFRRVNEGLTTSGLVSADALRELRGEGYDTVINLLPEGHEHGVADEGGILREQGVDYVHIPVDFEAPTHADFVAFDEAMAARTGAGKLHVHCAANYRVTAFYAVYAVRHGLCTESEADELVQSIWNPSEFPAWVTFIADERTRA